MPDDASEEEEEEEGDDGTTEAAAAVTDATAVSGSWWMPRLRSAAPACVLSDRSCERTATPRDHDRNGAAAANASAAAFAAAAAVASPSPASASPAPAVACAHAASAASSAAVCRWRLRSASIAMGERHVLPVQTKHTRRSGGRGGATAPVAPPPPPPTASPQMPPKRASFGDIGDTSTSNDEDVPVVDTPGTAERKGLIGSAMNLIGRMRSPSRDEAPAAPPPPPPPPPPPAPAPERPRAASPVHSEAGWATDDMTTASDESWETEPEEDEKRPRAKPLSPDAVAAAGKCPTSLPPPKLNQKRATPEVEKRKRSRPDALAAVGRCPTALPPPRASTNPATSPTSPSRKPKRAEPDDADATDGERTASPADLNPDLGGGFVASARAAMVRLYERYNPEKVDEVDTLLTKWPGREAQLLSAVEAKYSREEAAPASPAAVPKPADVLAAVMGDAGRTKSPTPERMPREIIFTRDGTP